MFLKLAARIVAQPAAGDPPAGSAPSNPSGDDGSISISGLPDVDPTSALPGVLNTAFAVIGGLSVVFLIIGAIQMTTSAGDPSGFAKGRNTALYALIGLVISIMAFSIVNFVTSRI